MIRSSRCDVLVSMPAAGGGPFSPVAAAEDQRQDARYRVVEKAGRWWFAAPDGALVFSLGLNHIDATPWRRDDAGGMWEKYGNSMERWLKEAVRQDLDAWEFNTVGWTQEMVVRGPTISRHSPLMTFEEYQWLGLPYCHLLPFAEIHQWDVETQTPDCFAKDFEDWCDYVARSQCARFRDDPKLIGYFYSDCPRWVHAPKSDPRRQPLFDPERLKTEAGKKALFELATQYYRVTRDAVRRYDKHHLILGDRYEAMAPLPDEVVDAALPFVDVFCFQHFGRPTDVAADLATWHAKTKKPVLLADHAVIAKQADGTLRTDGVAYAELLRLLRATPGCVGVHLCGAYIRNNTRKRGLRDEKGNPDAEAVRSITAANAEARAWMPRA